MCMLNNTWISHITWPANGVWCRYLSNNEQRHPEGDKTVIRGNAVRNQLIIRLGKVQTFSVVADFTPDISIRCHLSLWDFYQYQAIWTFAVSEDTRQVRRGSTKFTKLLKCAVLTHKRCFSNPMIFQYACLESKKVTIRGLVKKYKRNFHTKGSLLHSMPSSQIEYISGTMLQSK